MKKAWKFVLGSVVAIAVVILVFGPYNLLSRLRTEPPESVAVVEEVVEEHAHEGDEEYAIPLPPPDEPAEAEEVAEEVAVEEGPVTATTSTIISAPAVYAALKGSEESGSFEFAARLPDEAPVNAVEDYEVVKTQKVGNLTLLWTNHAMADRGDGTTFYDWAMETYPDFPSLLAEEWPTAPNVPNPLVDWFRVVEDTQVPDGIEIPDTGERNYCQVVEGEWCTNVVATGHYMIFTGDGFVPALWDGTGGEAGNAFSYWNVGETDARLDGVFLQGWRLTGRYWNGDALPFAIVGTHGNAANNMLNMDSALNPSPITNAGSNCASRDGCRTVEHLAVIGSGNAPLLLIVATTDLG